MKRLTEQIKNKETGEVLAYRLHTEVDRILAYRKLGELEDAEEQGILLRLPCKPGDTVWAITSPINLGFDEGEKDEVFECVVESITFYKTGNHQIRLYSGGVFVSWHVRFSCFGKTVFLTKAEAEKALKEMEG